MSTTYVCGCDVGSTYGKAVIMDLNGKIVGSSIVRSKIDPEETSKLAIAEATKGIDGLSMNDFAYLVGTGYGRNRVPFANENISEISCHAMGVHITNPAIKTIVDIGGQDLKGITIDENGSVKHFAMNDKCAAGTGRFFEGMARAFEVDLQEFSDMSLKAKEILPITSQCSVFAETEVISMVAQKKNPNDIAAGIQASVAKRCFTMLKSAGIEREVTMTGGCAKNKGLKNALEKILKFEITELSTDPQLMGALGACEFARKKALVAKAG
ncbi:MAG: hgdC [Firmicutes bacterium]|nr:hgdC [Bacillota bacterium]